MAVSTASRTARSEAAVADILRESQVFLSFGHPEGFGLPPAEALACGCLVIGYHGGGGREYFGPAGAYPAGTPAAGDDGACTRASCSANARPAHGLRPRGVNPSVRPASSPNKHSMQVRMSSASR